VFTKFMLTILLFSFQVLGVETFKIAIYYPQVPPYMYAADDNVPQGVVPELLNAFFLGQPYQLQYVFENRQRAELGVYEGKYDATVLAAKWTIDASALLFSQPIVNHRDFLYSLKPLQQNLANLDRNSICLRRYYKYDALNNELDKGSLIRVDSDSEFDQFNMLVNQRCDLAYMNEHVATWLINNHFSTMVFHRNNVEADQADLTLALNPKWAGLKQQLDIFIKDAHRRGVIEKSLTQHMKKTK